MDTFGGWHEEALALITQLGRALARTTGREDGEQVRHVRQRLGITLVRDIDDIDDKNLGNISMVLN